MATDLSLHFLPVSPKKNGMLIQVKEETIVNLKHYINYIHSPYWLSDLFRFLKNYQICILKYKEIRDLKHLQTLLVNIMLCGTANSQKSGYIFIGIL